MPAASNEEGAARSGLEGVAKPELPPERRVPAPGRLSPDHPMYAEIVAAHERSIELDTYGYRDPVGGLLVFSAKYLWERGYCCETGCRHCPYAGRPGTEDLIDRHRA